MGPLVLAPKPVAEAREGGPIDVGLSLFAAPHQEDTLLGHAHVFERVAEARGPPTFPERVASGTCAGAAVPC